VCWQCCQFNPIEVTGIIIEHEYGIFGGEHGENLILFLDAYTKPVVITLHTVLPNPSEHMRLVTTRIVARADKIVVLTENSKKVLEQIYPNSIGKVTVIPHGIHNTPFVTPKLPKKELKLSGRKVLSTFGLLSRGKGIEYVLNALPQVVASDPSIKYLVLGQTHPVVRREEGEKYRKELLKLVKELQLENHVTFYDQYFTVTDLLQFLAATDVYISTSINVDQAVSGTLSYALGSGRAVVSTEFAQAREIVNAKNGRLVPVRDSQAMTNALQSLLKDENKLKQMHRHAYKNTRHMLWKNVATEYIKLVTFVSPSVEIMNPVLPTISTKHLERMTDEFGLFQFANLTEPHKDYGYTLDDNARALIVASELHSLGDKKAFKLAKTYLAFIAKCQQETGKFINYIDHDGKAPTEQNSSEDLEDAYARAMWALSEVLTTKEYPHAFRNKAQVIFLKKLAQSQDLHHLRARATIIKAFSLAQTVLPFKRGFLLQSIEREAEVLRESINTHSSKTWYWFDTYLGYNNAVLSEAMMIAGELLEINEYKKIGKQSLQFLIRETFRGEVYVPIGHAAWYKRGEKRSEFDQQPEDPAATILALARAYKITHNAMYRHLAYVCFSWFLGNNILSKPLYDPKTGGCYDGLHPDRVNLNQGAESLVSYLLARLTIELLHTNEDPTNNRYFS
jgi:glycosyltransferase involved in cell wall biosynthesis